ncbi:MAG: hypothetical protein AB1758_28335, partial [Candidatus Eremiobacterota bacterium]
MITFPSLSAVSPGLTRRVLRASAPQEEVRDRVVLGTLEQVPRLVLPRTVTGPAAAPPVAEVPGQTPVQSTGIQLLPILEAEKGQPGQLNRLEPNLSMAAVAGQVRVLGARSIPEATNVARAVGAMFPQGKLGDGSLTEIHVVEDLLEIDRLAASPTGQVRRHVGPRVVVDEDGDYRRVYLKRGDLGPDLKPWQRLEFFREAAEPLAVSVPVRQDPTFGALLPEKPSVFVGGLISISAEPPEGFFAASTAAELQESGYPVRPAGEADLWLYRVPDSRPDSYFAFAYPNPDRPCDSSREGKFKIAAGVGPAANPASPGGAEADLLWLGDEQHGALRDYLETLARPDLKLSHLAAHQGFVQKLPDGSVLFGSANRAHALSKQGF